jgi:hypothetical protein
MASANFQGPGSRGSHWQRQADGTFLFRLDRSSKTRIVNANELTSLIEIQNREWAFVLFTLIPMLVFIVLWFSDRMESIWVLLAAAIWIGLNHHMHRKLRAQSGAILSTTQLSSDEFVFPRASIDGIAIEIAKKVSARSGNFCLVMSILFTGAGAVALVDGIFHLGLGGQEMSPLAGGYAFAFFGLLSYLFYRVRKLRP